MHLRLKEVMIKFSSYHSTYDKREVIIFLATKFSKNTLLLEMSFIILVAKKEETEFKTYFYDKNKSLIQISYREAIIYDTKKYLLTLYGAFVFSTYRDGSDLITFKNCLPNPPFSW